MGGMDAGREIQIVIEIETGRGGERESEREKRESARYILPGFCPLLSRPAASNLL